MRGYSAVGLINPKTEANVGGSLRAAHCYGASLVGIQGQRYKRQASDTTAAYRSIPLLHAEDIFSLIPYDCIPVAVEINEKSVSLPRFTHPERCFYIFGPEDGSIQKQIIGRCKFTVSIPTRFCMNLASTVNVVLYDRMVKNENLPN